MVDIQSATAEIRLGKEE